MSRIIITGASDGLWLQLCKTFLAKWYEVIWLSRSKPKADVIHIETDLTSKESLTKTAKQVKEKYPDFSCIISCAGIGYIEKLDAIDYDHTEETFKVNITGQGYLLSQLSDLIKNNKADLIFIGATIAHKGNEFMPMYSVSKWATRWLIENRRLELKNTACRVIGVHPGGMNTDSNLGPNGRETIISKMTGKVTWTLLDASEVAKFVCSLAQLPKNMEVSDVIINKK
jgi:NAD(P)-dependent dehydrogenase (short-subunit alcohol dehydrogenase family)